MERAHTYASCTHDSTDQVQHSYAEHSPPAGTEHTYPNTLHSTPVNTIMLQVKDTAASESQHSYSTSEIPHSRSKHDKQTHETAESLLLICSRAKQQTCLDSHNTYSYQPTLHERSDVLQQVAPSLEGRDVSVMVEAGVPEMIYRVQSGMATSSAATTEGFHDYTTVNLGNSLLWDLFTHELFLTIIN